MRSGSRAVQVKNRSRLCCRSVVLHSAARAPRITFKRERAGRRSRPMRRARSTSSSSPHLRAARVPHSAWTAAAAALRLWHSAERGSRSVLRLRPRAFLLAISAAVSRALPSAIILKNTGQAALVTSRVLGGANSNQFSQSSACGSSIAVGGSCTINLVFKPTTTGNKSATLTVSVADGSPNRTVTLSGTGIR